jgi:hypothetical protein
MPEEDHRNTGVQADAGSSGSHPVLTDVAEVARLISDADAYLSPTRDFDEAHLEVNDWPRDLDGPETLDMVGHLAEIVHSASGCVSGISCQHGIPDAAKPELAAIANLLTEAGSRLRVVRGIPGQGAQAASTAPDAGLDFPHAPATRPPSGSARPAAPRTAPAPAARPPKP